MQASRTGLAIGLATLLSFAAAANAATTDILIGIDAKITYGPDGSVNGPSGKDSLLVMDVANPAKPRIRASLPLSNSLLGPPTNLQITPDGKLGLLASSVTNVQDGSAWKPVPDDKLFVIDLTANPPKLLDTLTVGKQPSGLSIARKGDLALIANREGKSVSVVTIQGNTAKAVAEVPLGEQAAAVVIAPDGKRAFVALNMVNRIGVLAIDGQTVTYDKSMDIPAAFNPYNLDITPDGRFVIASCTGAGKNNGDAEVTIDATGPHPHVAALMSPGNGAEGFAISPTGRVAATPLIRGSGEKPSAWFHNQGGQLALMTVGRDGSLTVTARSRLGALPEGIAFSPRGDYLYVGNYIDQTLQVYNVVGNGLVRIGQPIKLPGQPASMRGPAH